MRTLYQFPISPAARKIRLALGEKKLTHDLQLEKPWERSERLLGLNPAAEIPVLVENDGLTLCGDIAISNFLDEQYPEIDLLGKTPLQRAETRRLIQWFDCKFYDEVSRHLITEKVLKRMTKEGYPSGQAIRAANANIHYHMDYISWLTDHRNWLAGQDLSWADLTAAAHFSCLDYLGDVPWERHPNAKDWYQRIKSRPCFQDILKDSLAGMRPPEHYTDLDF